MSAQLLHTYLAHIIAHVRQNPGNHRLQGLFLITTGFILELAHLSFGDKGQAVGVGLLNLRIFVVSKDGTGNNIVDSQREPYIRYNKVRNSCANKNYSCQATEHRALPIDSWP